MIRKLIKEVFQQVINEAVNKVQQNFDWHKYYPKQMLRKIETEGDNVILYHYGTDKGTGFLDPKKFGTYSYTSDVKQWSVPRVFFYVNPSDREWRVTGNSYRIAYPMNKLYPFNEDPYHFYEDCLKEYDRENLPVNLQLTCIGGSVIDAGFDGMIVQWGNTYRVDIWKKIPVGKSTGSVGGEDDETKYLTPGRR